MTLCDCSNVMCNSCHFHDVTKLGQGDTYSTTVVTELPTGIIPTSVKECKIYAVIPSGLAVSGSLPHSLNRLIGRGRSRGVPIIKIIVVDNLVEISPVVLHDVRVLLVRLEPQDIRHLALCEEDLLWFGTTLRAAVQQVLNRALHIAAAPP